MLNYSIIIPHYNIPTLLQRCIDSIPQRKDLEIIIVDDNSNGNIVDFKNFPGKERSDIIYIFNKENKGAGFSRNQAISLAKGKWILCVDADDFLLPNAFLYLDKYINTEEDVIIFKSKSCLSEDITQKGKREHAPTLNYLIDKCMSKEITPSDILFIVMSPWCKMVRNSFLKTHNIDFDLTMVSEDVMWSTKLAVNVKKCTASDKYIYCLTEREGSLTSENKFSNILIWFNILKRKNEYLALYNYDKFKTFFTYQDLSIIRSKSRIKYLLYIIKGIKNNMIKSTQFYNLEKKLGFKYPIIYFLLEFVGFQNLNKFPYRKKIWKFIR